MECIRGKQYPSHESKWKYYRSVGSLAGIPSSEDDFGTFLRRYPVPQAEYHYLNKIQPGIFVCGGVARQIALKEISDCNVNEIPATSDCDFVSFAKGGIYCGSSTVQIDAIYAAINADSESRLLRFFDNNTALTIDQVIAGASHSSHMPELFASEYAVRDYTERVIRLSRQEDVKFSSAQSVSCFGSVCRAVVLSQMLEPLGFSMDIQPEFMKRSLQAEWRNPIAQSKVRGMINKAKQHSVLDRVCSYFSRLGFMVSQEYIDEPEYITSSEY